MSLHKANHSRQSESGISLLQGLLVLAVLGVIVAVVVSSFA